MAGNQPVSVTLPDEAAVRNAIVSPVAENAAITANRQAQALRQLDGPMSAQREAQLAGIRAKMDADVAAGKLSPQARDKTLQHITSNLESSSMGLLKNDTAQLTAALSTLTATLNDPAAKAQFTKEFLDHHDLMAREVNIGGRTTTIYVADPDIDGPKPGFSIPAALNTSQTNLR